MRFTKQGVLFAYHGDHLLRRWPWAGGKSRKYNSSLYSRDFSSLREYWMHVGVVEAALIRTDKIEGYTWTELLSSWVRQTYPGDNVIVLKNLEASAKGVSFWSRLPKHRIEEILRDVVVLRCKDKAEVFRLVDSITPGFAEAYGFSAGQLIETNLGEFS